MVTGAASSEAALLLIDAARGRAGAVAPARLSAAPAGRRSRWRCWSTRWTWSATRADRFGEVAEEYRAYLRGLGVDARPASSRSRPARATTWSSTRAAMPWYQGPTVLQALDAVRLHGAADRAAAAPAGPGRLQVRPAPDHRRPDRERARLAVGDEVRVLAVQQDRQGQVDRGLERARGAGAGAGRASRSASRSTEQIFVERGEVDEPPRAARRSRATCSGRACSGSATSRCSSGNSYTLKLGTHRGRRSRSRRSSA